MLGLVYKRVVTDCEAAASSWPSEGWEPPMFNEGKSGQGSALHICTTRPYTQGTTGCPSWLLQTACSKKQMAAQRLDSAVTAVGLHFWTKPCSPLTGSSPLVPSPVHRQMSGREVKSVTDVGQQESLRRNAWASAKKLLVR